MTFVRILFFIGVLQFCIPLKAGLHTWDGKHPIDKIAVTVVYFVPRDRIPLPDWKERVGYFCRRIERFHEREYQGQSQLTTHISPEPFQSARTTPQLRSGDANFIYYQTLGEVAQGLNFPQKPQKDFPILLVLSDINWRELDDFYRLKPTEDGFEFEGNLNKGEHFPGAKSGGARASYRSQQGVGWGLVSADGWRVPYRGSDCVVYHEGVGHTIGLPHPEKANASVMSLGQYRGWINESWINEDQKKRLGWTAKPTDTNDKTSDLFSVFRALPEPKVPKPNEPVSLKLNWPSGAKVSECQLRIQTDLQGSWITIPQVPSPNPPEVLQVGKFDRPTPVSYRVDAKLTTGEDVELWGYFQVRSQPSNNPTPAVRPQVTSSAVAIHSRTEKEFDLLS
ncbi:MAG: hypothetical protein KDA84_17070, partial [Planctomycetaceae bacterium]|nr:hypothetical protein [Planctomycetaceae bacterium]